MSERDVTRGLVTAILQWWLWITVSCYAAAMSGGEKEVAKARKEKGMPTASTGKDNN